LSDSLEDIVGIPGIDVDTEAALSDGKAQRLHDRVRQQLDDICVEHLSKLPLSDTFR
jgi:hypothetical protein